MAATTPEVWVLLKERTHAGSDETTTVMAVYGAKYHGATGERP